MPRLAASSAPHDDRKESALPDHAPGRPAHRRAIALTALMLTIGLAAVGPSAVAAKDPPGLGKFMHAIGKVESGGRYTARNKTSGAYGKYQIMPSNWPSWAKRYLGTSKAKPTPANQERVARGKFTTLYKGLHSWKRVAYWWLTGSSKRTGWSPRARTYVAKVMHTYVRASARIPGAKGHHPKPSVKRQRVSERSGTVAYTGTWKTARHGAYAGDAVKYATSRGASATFAFTGKGVALYGPLGPTRGKARILIDGKLVKTIDLHRSHFTAHARVFARSWKGSGSHTLTIQVVGTRHHPMVAVDEFVVTR
jgi:hypothetical protein